MRHVSPTTDTYYFCQKHNSVASVPKAEHFGNFTSKFASNHGRAYFMTTKSVGRRQRARAKLTSHFVPKTTSSLCCVCFAGGASLRTTSLRARRTRSSAGTAASTTCTSTSSPACATQVRTTSRTWPRPAPASTAACPQCRATRPTRARCTPTRSAPTRATSTHRPTTRWTRCRTSATRASSSTASSPPISAGTRTTRAPPPHRNTRAFKRIHTWAVRTTWPTIRCTESHTTCSSRTEARLRHRGGG